MPFYEVHLHKTEDLVGRMVIKADTQQEARSMALEAVEKDHDDVIDYSIWEDEWIQLGEISAPDEPDFNFGAAYWDTNLNKWTTTKPHMFANEEDKSVGNPKKLGRSVDWAPYEEVGDWALPSGPSHRAEDWGDWSTTRVLGCPVCKSSNVRITWEGFGYIEDKDNIKVYSEEDSLYIPMADHEFEEHPKMAYYCLDCSHSSYQTGSETDFIIPKGHAAEEWTPPKIPYKINDDVDAYDLQECPWCGDDMEHDGDHEGWAAHCGTCDGAIELRTITENIIVDIEPPTEKWTTDLADFSADEATDLRRRLEEIEDLDEEELTDEVMTNYHNLESRLFDLTGTFGAEDYLLGDYWFTSRQFYENAATEWQIAMVDAFSQYEWYEPTGDIASDDLLRGLAIADDPNYHKLYEACAINDGIIDSSHPAEAHRIAIDCWYALFGQDDSDAESFAASGEEEAAKDPALKKLLTSMAAAWQHNCDLCPWQGDSEDFNYHIAYDCPGTISHRNMLVKAYESNFGAESSDPEETPAQMVERFRGLVRKTMTEMIGIIDKLSEPVVLSKDTIKDLIDRSFELGYNSGNIDGKWEMKQDMLKSWGAEDWKLETPIVDRAMRLHMMIERATEHAMMVAMEQRALLAMLTQEGHWVEHRADEKDLDWIPEEFGLVEPAELIGEIEDMEEHLGDLENRYDYALDEDNEDLEYILEEKIIEVKEDIEYLIHLLYEVEAHQFYYEKDEDLIYMNDGGEYDE